MKDKTPKRQLTRAEEFEIMKIVLDKFLLLGTVIMAFGFYLIVNSDKDLSFGFSVLSAGAIIMILFAYIMVKEYQFLSH